MDRRVIFHLEHRAGVFMGHWFQFMISGLRHINNTIIIGSDSSINNRINQNLEFYNKDNVKPPYYIYIDMKNFPNGFDDFHLQTLELIKDKFILIRKEDITREDIIVNNYGEEVLFGHNMSIYGISNIPIICRSFSDISSDGWYYLKDLLKININDEDFEKYNKNYYLCRSKSHLLNGNKIFQTGRRRQILNESELIDKLKIYNIESIFLEDYPVIEKIKLFSCAKIIISPNSSGMVFSMFLSDRKSSLVEINTISSQTSGGGRIWESLCESFNIPYYLYFTKQIDSAENMVMNISDFIDFLKKNNLIK